MIPDSIQLLTDWFSRSPALIMAPSVQFFTILIISFTIFVLVQKNRQYTLYVLLAVNLYVAWRLTGYGLLLLLLLAISDFYLALFIKRSSSDSKRSALFAFAIVVNFTVLFIAKYLAELTFMQDSWLTGVLRNNHLLSIIGISYLVFKGLGYVIDVYREIITDAEENLSAFLVYMFFFPAIVAGPITRAREFLPQIHQPEEFTAQKRSNALWLIALGVAKKVVIADIIAVNFLDRVFESPQYFSSTEVLIALFAVPMQIYFDFSGYTDIAVGTALLFGFSMKHNFNRPFNAVSVTDFWRRWHITLLDWLQEYIFSTLVFKLRNLRALGISVGIIVTFLISGIWHGATLVFLLWGGLHAAWLLLELLTKQMRESRTDSDSGLFMKYFWAVLSFVFIAYTFVVFKSPDIQTVSLLNTKLLAGVSLQTFLLWFEQYFATALTILASYVLYFMPERFSEKLKHRFESAPWYVQSLILVLVLYVVYQFSTADTKPFIYLEF